MWPCRAGFALIAVTSLSACPHENYSTRILDGPPVQFTQDVTSVKHEFRGCTGGVGFILLVTWAEDPVGVKATFSEGTFEDVDYRAGLAFGGPGAAADLPDCSEWVEVEFYNADENNPEWGFEWALEAESFKPIELEIAGLP